MQYATAWHGTANANATAIASFPLFLLNYSAYFLNFLYAALTFLPYQQPAGPDDAMIVAPCE